MIIKYPKKIDLTEFKKDHTNVTKYGLPSDIKYCKKCVISNQRPNTTVEFKHTSKSKKTTINFNDEGVCDACIVTEKKNQDIDWQERERELISLCDKYRSRNGNYDCLVPGSGGKDSFYASHILKYKFNMNPLTVTWAPNIYTDWGWSNFQAWIHSGMDNYLMTPNGKTHRLLTRLAVDNLLHPFQPFILGQKCFAPKMAIKFNIPLIFYGEQEAEYGTPVNDAMSSKRDWTFSSIKERDKMYFGGISYESLKNDFGLTDTDLSIYIPEDIKNIKSTSLDFRYLGYYLKWHPQSNYYYAAEHSNFKAAPERTLGTYSKYNSIDDKIDDFFYYTMGIKFGIGRATTDASQEIRSGDITRDEGVLLVNKFDHEFPDRFAEEIFKYLSISKSEFPVACKQFEEPILTLKYFNDLCDTFRSPHIWKYDNGKWVLRVPLK
jgi:N-acetyl sugar amidotransferase